MDPKRKKILAFLLFAVVFFLVGAGVGWAYRKGKELPQPVLIRENPTNYKFINPILFLQVPEDEFVPEFQELKKIIGVYVNNAIIHNSATDISVYFRELNTNRWVGINTTDKYAPGSLLKVASIIAFYRAAETNPDMLYKDVYLSPDSFNGNKNEDYYPPVHQTELGSNYSTEDLLSYAIVDSDNNAAGALDILVGSEILNKTFTDLRIPIANGKMQDDFMTIPMVSRLFRALYNGTYISAEFSEKALNLLSKTTFTKGIVAGIPPGIIIAHKFGERTFKTSGSVEVHELHDCGIVYMPNDPFFVCVMTKGKNFPDLQKIIGDISGIAWSGMKMINKTN